MSDHVCFSQRTGAHLHICGCTRQWYSFCVKVLCSGSPALQHGPHYICSRVPHHEVTADGLPHCFLLFLLIFLPLSHLHLSAAVRGTLEFWTVVPPPPLLSMFCAAAISQCPLHSPAFAICTCTSTTLVAGRPVHTHEISSVWSKHEQALSTLCTEVTYFLCESRAHRAHNTSNFWHQSVGYHQPPRSTRSGFKCLRRGESLVPDVLAGLCLAYVAYPFTPHSRCDQSTCCSASYARETARRQSCAESFLRGKMTM
jgi:hypothetical protein